jgi:putative NIF3 family GTP cyclohydrolase 1 type 2
MNLSRRHFTSLAGAACASSASTKAAAPLTAQQIVERIQKNVGVPWSKSTVDTLKTGTPDTPVTGIVTTFMSSLEVLQKAAASGKNFIITHEPTFYGHLDSTDNLANDPVYKYKREFIEKHKLVVFRFHDHWHMRKPDAVVTGLADLLGWKNYVSPSSPWLYNIPETTLAAAAADAQRRLNIRTIRVIGNPNTKFTKAGLMPGAPGMGLLLRMNDYEVYIGGEATEWEGISYSRDMVAAGIRKGAIMLGHEVSEEPGMKVCADWVKTFVTEIPVEWISSGEPFWRPA